MAAIRLYNEAESAKHPQEQYSQWTYKQDSGRKFDELLQEVQMQFGVAECATETKTNDMATGNSVMLAKSLFEEHNI